MLNATSFPIMTYAQNYLRSHILHRLLLNFPASLPWPRIDPHFPFFSSYGIVPTSTLVGCNIIGTSLWSHSINSVPHDQIDAGPYKDLRDTSKLLR
jgi:hypothetical protein